MSNTAIYDDIVQVAAADFDVPASWIKAVIGTETSFRSPAPRTWEAKVKEYSYGPMQILLSTARGLGFKGTPAELEDPVWNIAIGAAYLAQLRGRFGNDFRRVYSAYNSGNPDRWQTSAQVAANVERALTWLSKVGGSLADESELLLLAGVVVVAGLWWRSRKGK